MSILSERIPCMLSLSRQNLWISPQRKCISVTIKRQTRAAYVWLQVKVRWRYGWANQANLAFHPSGVSKWALMHVDHGLGLRPYARSVCDTKRRCSCGMRLVALCKCFVCVCVLTECLMFFLCSRNLTGRRTRRLFEAQGATLPRTVPVSCRLSRVRWSAIVDYRGMTDHLATTSWGLQ